MALEGGRYVGEGRRWEKNWRKWRGRRVGNGGEVEEYEGMSR